MGNSNEKFSSKTTAMEAADGMDLNGKNVLITGANSGIGKETARVLALHGAKVFMLCRNKEKSEKARQELIKSIKSSNKTFDEKKLIIMTLDLSSLYSVRTFVWNYTLLNEPVHFLINNAGIMALPKYTESADKYELQFAVNHLGHFYLAILLTPLLLKSAPSRLIVLGSSAHSASPTILGNNNFIEMGIKHKRGPAKDNYSGYKNYGLSKASNILFAREYHRRYNKNGIISVSLHPGVIPTNLFNASGFGWAMKVGTIFLKSIPQGAATTIRCVALSNDEIKGGSFYKDCKPNNKALKLEFRPNRGNPIKNKQEEENKDNDNHTEQKIDKESAEYRLWEWSEILIKQKGFKLTIDGFEDEEKTKNPDHDIDDGKNQNEQQPKIEINTDKGKVHKEIVENVSVNENEEDVTNNDISNNNEEPKQIHEAVESEKVEIENEEKPDVTSIRL